MESKQAKTPPLSTQTKLLCFDLETNGLHGEAFAAGAIVIDAAGKIHDQFTARVKIGGAVDPWVQQNVLPAIQDMPVTHQTHKDLREAFWKWYLKAEAISDYVLVSNGYPVEYRFLLKCQEENLDERYWQHPFPLLDVTSIVIQAGDIPAVKGKIQMQLDGFGTYLKHHPLHDAKISALTAFEAFRLTGRIK